MLSSFRSPGALLRFFLTAGIGVSIDLWSKWFAFSHLAMDIVRLPSGVVHVTSDRAYPFIPGWVEFEVTANQGAVFGMGQGRRALFVAVSIAAIGFLFYLFSTSGRKPVYQILLGMLLAGVLGNLYDRVTLGYVRDMIHALPRWPNFFKWIFNVADSLLCVGVSLMILYSLKPEADDPANPGENPEIRRR